MFLCSSSSAVGLWLNRLQNCDTSILGNLFLKRFRCVWLYLIRGKSHAGRNFALIVSVCRETACGGLFLRGWGFTALQQFQQLVGWLAAGETSCKKQAKTTRCDFIERVNDPHFSRSCIANSWQSQLEAKPKQALSPEGQSWQVWLAENKIDGMFSRWIRETSDLKSQSSSCLARLWNKNHVSIICVWTLNVMKTVDFSSHNFIAANAFLVLTLLLTLQLYYFLFSATSHLSQLMWLCKGSPGQLSGGLLSRLEALLVWLQWQDVLLLKLPLGWTVTQLDGQRVLS